MQGIVRYTFVEGYARSGFIRMYFAYVLLARLGRSDCSLSHSVLPPIDDYLYLRPRKKERERYRNKDAKKAADNFLYLRLLTVFSDV